MLSSTHTLRIFVLLAFVLLSSAMPRPALAEEGVPAASPVVSEQPDAETVTAGAAPQAEPEAEAAPVAVPVAAPSAIPAPALRAERAQKPEARPATLREVDLRPVLEMSLDAAGAQTPEQMASAAFVPFEDDVLRRDTGVVWLRFSLARVEGASPSARWLDLGTQMPAGTKVWLSREGLDWKEAPAARPGLYSLDAAGRYGQALVRLEGLPGLWSRPALRALDAAMASPEREGRTFLVAALGLFFLFGMVLSVTERSGSRFWTGILAAAAAVQALWSIPATASGIPGTFPGVFAAGVALFMMPHAGRVIMRTRESSPATDLLFLLFALPGACAAIVPLLPGMGWTARLLVFWPLASALCAVPAFLLVCRGRDGGIPFLLACLCMSGGAAAALYGMGAGLEAPLWALAAPAGTVCGLLFLVAASPFREKEAAGPAMEAVPLSVHAEEADSHRLDEMRRALRAPVEELLDEACRLDQALSRAGIGEEKVEVMGHADGMVAAARRLSERLFDIPGEASLPGATEEVFELRQVIRTVFASVSAEAERKGLGLAWYVAPHIGLKFRGDRARLTALLSLLLADSVRASSHGAVSLRVRRSPQSTHPGHLLFSISDNGEARPPHGRAGSLPVRAWELASACGGGLSMDSGPDGLELSFSMGFTAFEADGMTERLLPPAEAPETPMPDSRLVVVAAADSMSRQMLSCWLDGTGCLVWEARDAAEAASLYASVPAALVIFDGSLAEDDMVQAIASIRMFEGEQSLPPVPFLLLAADGVQAGRMGKAGCDEVLVRPVIRKDLRAMVKWLVAPSGSQPRPVLTSQRVTLAAVLAGAPSGPLRMQRKDKVRTAKPEAQPPAEAAPAPEAASAGAAPVEQAQPAPEALPLDLPEAKKEKGWLSSLFAGSAEEAAKAGPDPLEMKMDAAPAEAPIVELRSEDVLLEESGVHLLTDADRVFDDGQGGAEVPVAAEDPSAPLTASPEMEEPRGRIERGLAKVVRALTEHDVQGIRSGSRELAAVADRYGMHTLSDMALCFRAAWEEGDVEAAWQIVDEMRTEADRQC